MASRGLKSGAALSQVESEQHSSNIVRMSGLKFASDTEGMWRDVAAEAVRRRATYLGSQHHGRDQRMRRRSKGCIVRGRRFGRAILKPRHLCQSQIWRLQTIRILRRAESGILNRCESENSLMQIMLCVTCSGITEQAFAKIGCIGIGELIQASDCIVKSGNVLVGDSSVASIVSDAI